MSEAVAALHMSIPTVKRMVADGQLEAYRTPGGHLRILAGSVEAVRAGRQGPARPVRDASPVLHNRRERLEELTLEAQELRARRELDKLRREQAEEEAQRQAEAEARDQEAAERQAAVALEQARLERQQAQEQERREAEWELAAFRCRWLETTTELLAAKELRWLSATERKQILDAVEAEIAKRQPSDEQRMIEIVGCAIAAVIERLTSERQACDRRNRIAEGALRRLSFYATDTERARAAAAIRESLSRLPSDAQEFEVRATAEEAVSPVCQAVEKRLLDERLTARAVRQLPWGSDDRDKSRLRRECGQILAELAKDVSEADAKEALEPTIHEASRQIEQRQTEKERHARRANLIQHGVAEVSSYLFELNRDGAITSEELGDTGFDAELRDAVRRGLEARLSGGETVQDVRKLTRQIIDGELD